MEWNVMVLGALALGLVLGATGATLLQRRSSRSARERAEQLVVEFEETREEFDAHREEVAKHFEQTSNLFRDLTEQYTHLYAHLAAGAREFCDDEIPAIGRGLEGPLLGAPAEAEAGPKPSPDREEARPQAGNGEGRPATV